MPAHAQHPALAHAPTHRVVGVDGLARAGVGSRIAEVEVVHQLQIGIEAVRADAAEREHGLGGPVVLAEAGRVLAVVFAGGRVHVQADHVVQRFGQVIAQRHAQRHVAQAGAAVTLAAGLEGHVQQRRDGMEGQLAAQHLPRRDPDQARGQHVDVDLEVRHRQALAVVAAQLVVARAAAVDQHVHPGRRQRARHEVLQAVRIDAQAAAFGGLRHAAGQR
ncbi:Uncharacterised protein [Achromobacter ruhlandii]|nr:Uncharacterised protein [Achromobacter ruhlandii]CUJ67638.1 Uncharacterised protein [Achromobacter ruhlandii]CUJ98489.1 Uncharacterised protein [Achromobacter ruhlandii]